VTLTYDGAPYAQADVKKVKYLLYNAKGEVAQVGEAEFVAEGQYKVIRKMGPSETRYYRALLLNYPNDEDRRQFD